MIVDEKEATSSVLSLPLTHFGCGQGRSLFFAIKSHTVAGYPLQETPRWPIFSILSEELVSEQLTGTRAVSWPQARVPLGPGPRDSQGPKVAEGEQEPWAAGWEQCASQLKRVLPLGEPGGHRPRCGSLGDLCGRQHGSEPQHIGGAHGYLPGAPLPGWGFVLEPRKEVGMDVAPELYFHLLKVI